MRQMLRRRGFARMLTRLPIVAGALGGMDASQ
jgi:hypothetical protein